MGYLLISMKKEFLLFTIIAISLSLKISAPGCTHPIFCNDTILTAVAKSNYFKDSKTFVDQILKIPVS